MLTVIIVDDNLEHIKNLQKELKKIEDIVVLGIAQSVDTAKVLITELQPSIVFLDVQMPEKDGFELFNELSVINFEVIFVSSFPEYAIQAIKVSALDYLVKPVNFEELETSIDRVRTKFKHTTNINNKENIKILKQNLEDPISINNRIVFETAKEKIFVKWSQIVFLNVEGDYTKIHLDSTKSILILSSLSDTQKRLSSKWFYRIHQSHIINFHFLARFVRSPDPRVILNYNNKMTLKVSKRNKKGFIEWLNNKSY